MSIDELIEHFTFIDDWEERYRYVIELGRELAPLPEVERNDANLVRGCASQVWLLIDVSGDGADAVLTVRGDSDAHIVKGLVYIVTIFYSGKTARQAAEADAFSLFKQLGLAEHLTPQRANGVRSMIERIRHNARVLCGVDQA